MKLVEEETIKIYFLDGKLLDLLPFLESPFYSLTILINQESLSRNEKKYFLTKFNLINEFY